jgi:hypothetical protein
MQKSSWMVLAVCAALALCLGVGYVVTSASPPPITREHAVKMLDEMNDAVARKDVGALMRHVNTAPDQKIAGMRPDQLRLMIMRGMRGSGKLTSQTSNVLFTPRGDAATLEFDLLVVSREGSATSEMYRGHVVLGLKRMDVPRMLGLFQGKEWLIVSAEHNGRDLNSFGDY